MIPNAEFPINTGTGDAVYPIEPEPMADALAEFVRDFESGWLVVVAGRHLHLEAVVQAVRSMEEPGRRSAPGPSGGLDPQREETGTRDEETGVEKCQTRATIP